jgi:hypothetical protein
MKFSIRIFIIFIYVTVLLFDISFQSSRFNRKKKKNRKDIKVDIPSKCFSDCEKRCQSEATGCKYGICVAGQNLCYCFEKNQNGDITKYCDNKIRNLPDNQNKNIQ